jgi:hypothetical protein
MLQTEKFNITLVLTFFFSFFLYNISWISLIFIINLKELLISTFLENFINMLDIVLVLILQIVKYITLLFMVGSIITLLITFLMDFLINQKNN